MFLRRALSAGRQFPKSFWVLLLASYVDNIGRSAVVVFFALYVTQRFGVGMTEAGVLIGLFGVAGLAGSALGGALTDHFGRRSVMIFGLVSSAFATLSFAFIPSIKLFYPAILIAGLFSDIGGPAQQAMVADLLPEEKRSQGFGAWRVVANLGWLTGPIVGGLLAETSIAYVFGLDAILSSTAAIIVFFAISETYARAPHRDGGPRRGLICTFAGYRGVMADVGFLLFLVPCLLATVAYQQSYATLTVFLRDVHRLSEQAVGSLFSLDALFVVLLQFVVIHVTRKRSPYLMLALGTAFSAVGLALYGVVLGYPMLLMARLTIATGEMVWAPTGQALASKFASEETRGRYMAVFGLTFGSAAAVAPWLGGLVLDNLDPRWVWLGSGLLSAVAVACYGLLHVRNKRRASGREFGPGTPSTCESSSST